MRYAEADELVRALLAATFRNSLKSVEQIADRMSVRLNRQITARILRELAAPSKTTMRFPLLLLPALLEATGDGRLLSFALGPEGGRIFKLGEAAADILSEAAQRKLLARRKRARHRARRRKR
jgi:hypothetical protein